MFARFYLLWIGRRPQVAPTVRRRLRRIVRNSLWLSLTHYATPPFPQKSRSARLFGCKRPHDGSLSLPTFADLYIAFSRELHIILTINGGSKPPPYRAKSNLWVSQPLWVTFTQGMLKMRLLWIKTNIIPCKIFKSIFETLTKNYIEC